MRSSTYIAAVTFILHIHITYHNLTITLLKINQSKWLYWCIHVKTNTNYSQINENELFKMLFECSSLTLQFGWFELYYVFIIFVWSIFYLFIEIKNLNILICFSNQSSNVKCLFLSPVTFQIIDGFCKESNLFKLIYNNIPQ